MKREIILTGLRANNELHLGNYLGALLPMVNLQKKYAGKYQINLFVPDLHSFTTPIDHSKLYDQTMQNIRIFIAAGLDLDDTSTYIYRQSFIPAHSELTLILNCFVGMGELSRMTQYKDKSAKLTHVTAGLFDYPVLMAADILLYGSKYIPVGDDQTQHIELARDIGLRFNNKFKSNTFDLPVDIKQQLDFTKDNSRLRIRDLVDPVKKMSKSDETGKGVIFLDDSPEIATKKIMSATTDSFGIVRYDYKSQPGVSNLIEILACLNHSEPDVVALKYTQKSYSQLKSDVAESVGEFLVEFQEKLKNVDDAAMLNKLENSEKEMNEVAKETLLKVQKLVGLRSKNATSI